ncbi:S-layer homology domain-containing protein [Paenibacillus alkaliterrae]|uniref:S-layer homology domain-containing protein n=1 Tax=Paenibacillus alkaliterrae TaxID=320909 RepID=UPI001F2B4880|nr:S-layer homology domain-containing protein [Paenibacillus alkaliterrae]MCF2939663.1 S-layer homology domain-containing protein [Paenibacillus alkaliterrae]
MDTEAHWAREAIDSMTARLIVSGSGKDTFSPNRKVTRSEFAAIAVRSLGFMRAVEESSAFSDVRDGTWEHDPVVIASESGIVSGFENGTFQGDSNMTREQGMVMLANALQLVLGDSYVPMTEEEADAVLQQYGDGAQASDWAKPSIACLIKAGIVRGDDSMQLHPLDTLTRAQAVTIISSMLEHISYI